MTLTDLCDTLRNWFDVARHFGDFEIKNGTIDLDTKGQFLRIIGSFNNDGVVMADVDSGGHKTWYHILGIKDDDLIREPLYDETFKGAVWELALPLNFLIFYDKINKWEEENKKAIDNPFTSESFGGYSYSKENSENLNWKTHFKTDLARWQKL